MPVIDHADATAHAQSQCWKGSSGHKTCRRVLQYCTLQWLYRVHGACALQSSSYKLISVPATKAIMEKYWTNH